MSLAKGATLQIVDSQVSPTLRISASGQDPSLGFSCKHAGHSTIKKRPLRRFKVAPELGMAVLGILSNRVGDTHSSKARQVEEYEANVCAFTLLTARNAARAALTAHSARGQLASWKKALSDLPDDYCEAVDYLEVFTQRLVEELQTDLVALTPHIARLNESQPSKACWARPVPKGTQRGIWTGREDWIDHAVQYLIPLMCGPSCAIAESNLRAIVSALAARADQSGRNVTAAHKTIAKFAQEEFGCTLAESTAEQRARTIRRLLEKGNFLITHVRGGHLTSLERVSAEMHHGGRQTRCGSTCDLNLPEHLRPTPPPSPKRPAYSQGLNKRLAERDREYRKKSTYTVGSGFQSLTGNHWVAHASAQPREQNFISSTKTKPLVPSLRARKIADALTRQGIRSAAESGPYAHLVGDSQGQMRLGLAAQLIERYTPDWADTRQVMQALAHAATCRTTGYIALGLRTRPSHAAAWFTEILKSADWSQAEYWPSWSVTAQAFGVHWCGDRHQWRPFREQTEVSEVPSGPPASAAQRAVSLAQIRQAIAR